MSRNFLCRCEDIDTGEVHEAIEEGHDDLESLRRFTAIGTGPCQGKACIVETIRLLAEHHNVPEDQIGQMTLRPPYAPVPLGLLAALPRKALEQLLDGEERRRARTTREALEAQDGPKTGRATPDSIRRSLSKHKVKPEDNKAGDGKAKRSTRDKQGPSRNRPTNKDKREGRA